MIYDQHGGSQAGGAFGKNDRHVLVERWMNVANLLAQNGDRIA
jgi:hypothetical protein